MKEEAPTEYEMLLSDKVWTLKELDSLELLVKEQKTNLFITNRKLKLYKRSRRKNLKTNTSIIYSKS